MILVATDLRLAVTAGLPLSVVGQFVVRVIAACLPGVAEIDRKDLTAMIVALAVHLVELENLPAEKTRGKEEALTARLAIVPPAASSVVLSANSETHQPPVLPLPGERVTRQSLEDRQTRQPLLGFEQPVFLADWPLRDSPTVGFVPTVAFVEKPEKKLVPLAVPDRIPAEAEKDSTVASRMKDRISRTAFVLQRPFAAEPVVERLVAMPDFATVL